MQALWSSTTKSAKAWSDSSNVWTTTWALWPLQSAADSSLAMPDGYEPPLLWLRHDRTPLNGEVRVMLNGTTLYKSLRTGARETSADKPVSTSMGPHRNLISGVSLRDCLWLQVVMAPGCGRRLSSQGSEGLLETIELRELPGYSGHVVTVQILGAAGADTAVLGGAKTASDKVLGMRATALRTVRYALTLDDEPLEPDTASPDYLRKYSRYVARTGQWHKLCFGGLPHKIVSISRTRKDAASGSVQYSLDVGDTIAPADRTIWYRYSQFAQVRKNHEFCIQNEEFCI